MGKLLTAHYIYIPVKNKQFKRKVKLTVKIQWLSTSDHFCLEYKNDGNTFVISFVPLNTLAPRFYCNYVLLWIDVNAFSQVLYW